MSGNIKPISPAEAGLQKAEEIPAIVIAIFNRAIISHLSGATSQVPQNEIIDKISKAYPSMSREEIFKLGWLDIEPLFRQAGWKVRYSKTAWNETGDSYFIFSTNPNLNES